MFQQNSNSELDVPFDSLLEKQINKSIGKHPGIYEVVYTRNLPRSDAPPKGGAHAPLLGVRIS